jgi:hypothetical protein
MATACIARIPIPTRRVVATRAQGNGKDAPEPMEAPKLTKRGKPMPKPQKPRRRKPKTGGNQGATMKETPSAADVAAGDRFDDIVARGGIVVEVFVRAAGPNQWFPVGPLAVMSTKAIKREIWAAEEPLRKAAFKMYPALAKPPAFGRVEYGYRERDEEKKISEADIREAEGKKNPFDDVILLTREDDSTESESEGFFSKIKKALNPYDG